MKYVTNTLRFIFSADDAEEEAEEEEEQEDVKPGKSIKADPEKAFQRLGDVKKFNYLLGMSMWMLTEEKKNELLKQRDQKLAELAVLKKQTPEMLWMADLDALSQKLNEVEENERLEAAGLKKKKVAVKKEPAGKQRQSASKKKYGRDETKPSDDGMEVKFKVTAEMLKKAEKAVAGATGPARVKKEKVEPGEEIDEFDALVAGAEKSDKVKKPRVKKEPGEKKPRVKKEKDGLKQTKITFGEAGKKNVRNY